MLDKNLLLVDIGGTNIRYAYSNIGDSGFVSENMFSETKPESPIFEYAYLIFVPPISTRRRFLSSTE